MLCLHKLITLKGNHSIIHQGLYWQFSPRTSTSRSTEASETGSLKAYTGDRDTWVKLKILPKIFDSDVPGGNLDKGTVDTVPLCPHERTCPFKISLETLLHKSWRLVSLWFIRLHTQHLLLGNNNGKHPEFLMFPILAAGTCTRLFLSMHQRCDYDSGFYPDWKALWMTKLSLCLTLNVLVN